MNAVRSLNHFKAGNGSCVWYDPKIFTARPLFKININLAKLLWSWNLP